MFLASARHLVSSELRVIDTRHTHLSINNPRYHKQACKHQQSQVSKVLIFASLALRVDLVAELIVAEEAHDVGVIALAMNADLALH